MKAYYFARLARDLADDRGRQLLVASPPSSRTGEGSGATARAPSGGGAEALLSGLAEHEAASASLLIHLWNALQSKRAPAQLSEAVLEAAAEALSRAHATEALAQWHGAPALQSGQTPPPLIELEPLTSSSAIECAMRRGLAERLGVLGRRAQGGSALAGALHRASRAESDLADLLAAVLGWAQRQAEASEVPPQRAEAPPLGE